MCKCFDDLKAALEERFLDTTAKDDSGFVALKEHGFDNRVFVFSGSTVKCPVVLPYTFEYTRKTKSGKIQKKKINTSIHLSNCPFCGEVYGKE